MKHFWIALFITLFLIDLFMLWGKKVETEYYQKIKAEIDAKIDRLDLLATQVNQMSGEWLRK